MEKGSVILYFVYGLRLLFDINAVFPWTIIGVINS